MDERAGTLEDLRDLQFDYPRASAEKALLDWVYLGASNRSRMTRPPFDLDLQSLDARRVKRLAKNMRVTDSLAQWLEQYRKVNQAQDVMNNTANFLL